MKRTILFTIIAAALSASCAYGGAFYNISITGIANWNLSTFYQAPPTGDNSFDGIPFTIAPQGSNVFFSQDAGMGSSNPVVADMDVNISHPKCAYILIAGTDVRLLFQGRQMGDIVFRYADSTSTIFPLVVGDTIRDWVTYPERVTTTANPAVSTVWRGTSQGGWGYREAVIDMLTLPLRQESTLTGITFHDKSAELLDDAGPGIYIHGVTIESVPEPSSLLPLLCGLGGLLALRRR